MKKISLRNVGLVREDIIRAIEEFKAQIDNQTFDKDRESVAYDLVYKNESFPPKYIVELAYNMKNPDNIIGPSNHSADIDIKLLKSLDFEVVEKSISDDKLKTLIGDFIRQAKTSDQTTRQYINYNYNDTGTRASFGAGNKAAIAWFAFLAIGQTVTKGIYPVLLFNIDKDEIVIAYGVSETNKSSIKWPQEVLASQKIESLEWPRYRESYIFSKYKDVSIQDIDQLAHQLMLDIKNLIEYYNSIFSDQNILEKNKTTQKEKGAPMNNIVLNQILYGPPGTSKTYSVTNKALEIIDGESPKDQEDAKKRFEELQVNGQISMVTFHQSYGYEEFVEGLKASSIDGQISYDIQDGIFKKISLSAQSIRATSRLENFNFDTNRIFKMSLGGIYDPDIREWCIDNDYISMGWGEDVDFTSSTNELKWTKYRDEMKVFLKDKVDEKDIKYTTQVIYQFKNYMKKGDLVLVSHGNSKIVSIGQIEGEYEFNDNAEIKYSQFRKVKWLIKDANIPIEKVNTKKLSQQTLYEFDKDAIKKDSLLKLFDVNKESNENYVLIIDEINRGNISKIFGELITLIEPSKRMGAKDELRVTLPYSSEEFSIPSNLHIIGTMNTADRSIALLDTALRRRFDFIEMMPDIKLIQEKIGLVNSIDVAGLLNHINKRIEVLYDRDHMIGHAYFLDVKTFDDLRGVMRNRVIPLLQEYFYDDWKKINMIFNNNGFIVEKSIKENLFSNVEDPDLDEEQKIYSLNMAALDDKEEYQKIYQ